MPSDASFVLVISEKRRGIHSNGFEGSHPINSFQFLQVRAHAVTL